MTSDAMGEARVTDSYWVWQIGIYNIENFIIKLKIYDTYPSISFNSKTASILTSP